MRKDGLGSKPALLFNAGLSYEKTDACEHTADLFERFLALQPDAAASVGDRLKAAQTCAPIVRIDSNPPGAKVEIDDVSRGLTPLSARLRSGKHEVRITLHRHVVTTRAIEVLPGVPSEIEVNLEPERVEAYVRLEIDPDVTVELNDELVRGPHRGSRKVAPGSVAAVIRRDACAPEVRQLTVEAGNSITLWALEKCPKAEATAVETTVERTEERSGALPAVAWIASAASIAALGVGVGFAVVAQGAASDREAELEKPLAMRSIDALHDAEDRATSHASRANIMYGTAGAFAVGALILWIVEWTAEAE